MAKMETLIDSFGGSSINGSLWTNSSYSGATASEGGGVLTCTPASNTAGSAGEIDAATTYDLTGSYALLNVVQVGSANTYTTLDLVKDATNKLSWFVQAG